MPAPIRKKCVCFARGERIVEVLVGCVSLIKPALNMRGAHRLQIETRCAAVRNCSLSTMLANCPDSGKACETRAEDGMQVKREPVAGRPQCRVLAAAIT